MNLEMILQRVNLEMIQQSESGDDSTKDESGDDDDSTEVVWHDMILEVYNTEDYAQKWQNMQTIIKC